MTVQSSSAARDPAKRSTPSKMSSRVRVSNSGVGEAGLSVEIAVGSSGFRNTVGDNQHARAGLKLEGS